MKGSGIRNVAVAAVVLAALAVWAWSLDQGGGDLPEGAGETAFPALAERLNDVDRVAVEADGGGFTLEKKGGEWFVAEWGGFPATFDTVKQTVVGVSQLVLDEPKTKRPDKWSQLGVDDPGPGRASLRLEMSAGGEVVADVVVGRMKGRDAVYIRENGAEQSWLADGRVSPARVPSGWVDAEILRLPADRMQRVVVTHPDGEHVTIRRTGDDSTDWELRELDLGQELVSPGLLTSLAGALTRLALEAVVPPGDVDEAAPEWTVTRYETKDGIAIDVRTAEVDGKTVARLRAEALPREDPAEGDDADGGADDERPPGEIAAEVADLNGRIATWTYVLPSWKLQSLVKRLDDLVQPTEPEEAAPEDVFAPLQGGEDG